MTGLGEGSLQERPQDTGQIEKGKANGHSHDVRAENLQDAVSWPDPRGDRGGAERRGTSGFAMSLTATPSGDGIVPGMAVRMSAPDHVSAGVVLGLRPRGRAEVALTDPGDSVHCPGQGGRGHPDADPAARP